MFQLECVVYRNADHPLLRIILDVIMTNYLARSQLLHSVFLCVK